jgi:TldD protein
MNALLIAILAATPASTTNASLTAEDELVFSALKAELSRAMKLSISENKNKDTPYFGSATLDEVENTHLTAEFGAISSRGSGKRFSLDASLRVGTPQFDNTNFQNFNFDATRAPAEIDTDAIRTALWLKFDKSYKSAIEALSRKKAFLETNQSTVVIDDFSKAPVATLISPRSKMEINLDAMGTVLKKTSAVFLENSQIIDARVSLEGENLQQWFVSSEAAQHRFGESTVAVTLSTFAQAKDGMDVRLQKRFTGLVATDLPNEKELVSAAQLLMANTIRMANAAKPTDDYQGPVLFVGEAAPSLFLEILGEPLAKPREALGSRVQGRLIERLGKRVAIKTLTARDDAAVEYFSIAGTKVPLWGHFVIDDESVVPTPVTLVNNGVLQSYYMSRSPTERIKETNGHARGQAPAAGNLFIETSKPESRAELKKKLIELAKDEDLEFGLMVESLEPSGGRSDGLSIPAPTLIFKVYADGREEPVRGFTFKPVSQRLMKDIAGMGDDPTVLNVRSAGQKTSVVAPSVLVKLMELSRTQRDFAKPPALPRP